MYNYIASDRKPHSTLLFQFSLLPPSATKPSRFVSINSFISKQPSMTTKILYIMETSIFLTTNKRKQDFYFLLPKIYRPFDAFIVSFSKAFPVKCLLIFRHVASLFGLVSGRSWQKQQEVTLARRKYKETFVHCQSDIMVKNVKFLWLHRDAVFLAVDWIFSTATVECDDFEDA